MRSESPCRSAGILFTNFDCLTVLCSPRTFVVHESTGLLDGLAIVLVQEIVKFNRLLARMEQSCADLNAAVRGLVVMSNDLEAMYTALLNNQVGVIDWLHGHALRSHSPSV